MRRAKEATLTVSEIAELAGVSSSAVSNWKKRFDDFPDPVATAPGGRELYSIDAVERWLQLTERWDAAGAARRAFFDASQILRNSSTAYGDYLEVMCSMITLAYLHNHSRQGSIEEPIQDIADRIEDGNRAARGLFISFQRVSETTLSEAYESLVKVPKSILRDLFEDVLKGGSRFEGTRSGSTLTSLLISLTEGMGGTAYDPAAGEGGFLLALAQVRPGIQLFGQEIDASAARLARQRLIIHDVQAEVRTGDSLAFDAFTDLKTDIVLCDPPYGVRIREDQVGPGTRWSYGLPPRHSADLLWIQHSLHHLNEKGRAYVLLPPATLWRSGNERGIREALLRVGAIEAVVMLPSGAAEHTNIPLALWVLRSPDDDHQAEPVLFVNAEGGSDKPARLGIPLIRQISAIVARWRETQSIEDEDRSIAGSANVLDLLADDVNLAPKRWVVERVTPAARTQAIEESRHRLDKSMARLLQFQLSWPAEEWASGIRWAPIRELVEGGIAEVIRGITVRPDECAEEGVRIIRTRDIGVGCLLDVAPCFVDMGALRGEPRLTIPGDVLVSPGGGEIKATVDSVGGHAVASPVQILRFRVDWLDPEVAAAFLTSRDNSRLVTGTTHGFGRVRLGDLRLPTLSPEQAVEFRQTLRQLREIQALAQVIDESSVGLRDLLLNAAITQRGAE